jgi:hypothetical protein
MSMNPIFDHARACANICDHRRRQYIYTDRVDRALDRIRLGDRTAWLDFQQAIRLETAYRRLADAKTKRLPLVIL